MFYLQELHNVNTTTTTIQQATRSCQNCQTEYCLLTKHISRTDLNFLTLSRRKRIPGCFSTSSTVSTSTSRCSLLPGPDIGQPALDNEKCSQDQPVSLLCLGDDGGGDGGDGGDGGVGVVKKIPPKVAPKPRHSLIIQLDGESGDKSCVWS